MIFLLFFRGGGNAYFGEANETFNGFLREHGNYQFLFAAYIQRNLIYPLVGYLLLIFALVGKEMRTPHFFTSLNKFRVSQVTIFGNIFSFFALSALMMLIRDPEELINNPYSFKSITYILSPIVWGLYLYSICDAIFSIRQFLRLVAKNYSLVIFVCLIELAALSPGLMGFLIDFWSNLLLIPTIQVATGISHIFGLNYQMLPELVDGMPVFGTSQFEVEIWPGCSGYEGMSLIMILLAIFLFIQRNSLRVFRAFLLIPIAGLTMFFLNSFRIFALVALGHYWSPQLAMDGWHAAAGWLNLLVVFMFSLLALNYISFFQKVKASKTPVEWGDVVLLLPLMLLIIAGLVTKAASLNFPWLYPVHIVIAALVLYCLRKFFLVFLRRPSILSIVIGMAVFILWILLIPENSAQSTHFIDELNMAPLWLVLLWLLFRVVGASIIVPIAEEFAFRGYIQPQLKLWFDRNGFKSSSAIASLGLTALLFGYLHSEILAGSIAGLFFGFAYLLRRQLIDAVVAHAVTNSLLALYVLSFGYWSYW